MCGIAGIMKPDAVGDGDIQCVQRMNQVQKHRGPDDEGLFSDERCVLGHRRLSIIDLSHNGHQPFYSDDRRYVMVYNGEIYNYIELREELEAEGNRFRTQTDTEVLLTAYLRYGSDCLDKLNGMFAFAVYDTAEKVLFLARDRMGIKPLYYALDGDVLYFASEIKALNSIDSLKRSVNHQSLFDYIVFNRTDVFDETFQNEIKRLPKGHCAVFQEGVLDVWQWWDPERYLLPKQDIGFERVTQTVEELMISAARWQMRSDVTVGSCLSGGLDSSALLGILYSHQCARKGYDTVTAAFPGFSLDETKYIDRLNEKYPFTNHRVTPNGNEAFDRLRDFVYTNEEPTTGATFYSQYEVMRLAKEKNITVLLDGQGGDENFAGYPYFHGFWLYGLWRRREYARFLGDMFKTMIRFQDKTAYQTLFFQMMPDHKRRELLYRTVPYLEKDFFDRHIEQSRIYKGFFDADSLNKSILRHFQYKLEHLLRTEDRNSMAFSIEARVPYLDHRLVEFLLGVPEHYKIRSGQTKYLQRSALGKYSIPEIVNRKDKVGFATPMEEWMSSSKWRALTEENFRRVRSYWPEIFKKNEALPPSPGLRWKINQLSVWREISIPGK